MQSTCTLEICSAVKSIVIYSFLQANSPRGVTNEESVTPLVLACANRDLSTVDLLLRAGARDDDCKALAVVVAARFVQSFPENQRKRAFIQFLLISDFSFARNAATGSYSYHMIYSNCPHEA